MGEGALPPARHAQQNGLYEGDKLLFLQRALMWASFPLRSAKRVSALKSSVKGGLEGPYHHRDRTSQSAGVLGGGEKQSPHNHTNGVSAWNKDPVSWVIGVQTRPH
jgi:hypothetical protein